MRRTFAVLLPLFLAGCSVDTSGLGDEITDDASTDDGSVTSDETGALFDADVDAADSTLATPDTAADETTVTLLDAPEDSVVSSDAADDGDATTDTGEPDTDAAETEADSAMMETSDDTGTVVDSAMDAPADTGLVSMPGSVSCSHSGTAKVCTGNSCCGSYDLLSLSWTWDCASSCFAGREYKCDEKADCGSKLCCASHAIDGTINGSDCNTSCSNEQLCTTDAECGTKTCTPQKAPGSPQTIGICR